MKLEKIVKKARYWATPLYDQLPSWIFPERQLNFKAYCVGMGKTGTVSIHVMFSHRYRSSHEAESRFLIYHILAFVKGKINEEQFTRYLRQRNRRLGLEMDSSTLNYMLLDVLVKEFSEAKFILTIRDCYSWLDSFINHYLARPELTQKRWRKQHWLRFDNFRFKADQFSHTKAEHILAKHNLYTLDGYFSHWAEVNNKVLTTVPADRLLVIKTPEINQSIPKIEEFLHIEPNTLPIYTHGNKGSKKFHILSQIDKNFLEEKAQLHCQELMDKYFPEVTDFESSPMEKGMAI